MTYIFRGRLNGTQRRLLIPLLDMLYTPVELAETISITRRQIYRVYRHIGMPCSIDSTGHILINGKEFREWYNATYPKTKLGPNQTFCKTCRRGVEIINPQTYEKDGLIGALSKCPICGRKLSRFIANRRKRKSK